MYEILKDLLDDQQLIPECVDHDYGDLFDDYQDEKFLDSHQNID